MTHQTLTLRVDYRIVSAVLLSIILVMLVLWRPWSTWQSDDRTVQVTGEATIRATPEQFLFQPSYQFTQPDKSTALAEANNKANAVVDGLKDLGVEDKAIKSTVDGYKDFKQVDEESYTYTAAITVTLTNSDLVQKIQDYLVTTEPQGSVTPYPTFSEAQRKKLENEARGIAMTHAREKADQSATKLGFRVGSVKSVDDGAGFGGIMPLDSRSTMSSNEVAPTSPSLQPGENELKYTVTVTYFIR